jgi:small-conductance mechanosensitive channel
MSFTRRLVLLFCVVASPCLQAEDFPASDFSDKAAINLRLQQAQSELQQHNLDSDPLTQELLKRLETTIYHHQAAVDFLAAKESQRERAAEAARSWIGFDHPPPYSILISDDLRMQLISLRHLQRATESRIQIVTGIMLDSADQLTAYQRADRELAELAETGESRQAALISLQQNDISLRTEAEKVAYLALRQRGVHAELATFKTEQELVELQLKSIKGQTTFSQPELDQIIDRIASERTRVLEMLDTPGDNAQGADIRIAWLAEFLDAEERFWKTRFAVHSIASLSERKNALEDYKIMIRNFDAWAQVGETLAGERLIGSGERAEKQVLPLDYGLRRIRRLQNHVNFAISELEGSAIFGVSLLNSLFDTALVIWGTELYLVEDTTSFEGKRVTSYRAITLGKIIRLAFILAIGWFTLRFLSRRVRKLASRRTGSSQETANSIARWMFGIGLGLLIIYGLKLVRIPFTAFAFLGGTLAIGIGFGAQTLVKNFISGIILVLERPFKVGDFIEVDDVTGQIQRIGMRSSVIEHVDGIETLIPNSALLDNRVDNWTFGRTAIRGAVSVGVAYGSNTRDVSRSLLSAALQHGQVLDRPEPEVRFEAFGDSSLVFQLLFWVDATKIQRDRLASDLRFMMEKALNEAGITIAYPQRDIHFDSTRPLQVEVSSLADCRKPEPTDK